MAGVVEDVPQHQKLGINDENNEIDDNPIEQVRLTVSINDDPTQPTLTFRTWVLGLTSCVLLAFVNEFFGFRTNPLGISSVAAQIVTLPLGKLMAATLPTKSIHVPLTKWSFSLNPGSFSMKEHALITILAGCGSSGVYAIGIVTIVKAFYHRSINPIAGFLLALTTQLLGYGWAGIFRKFLVDSPYMWWPANLVQNDCATLVIDKYLLNDHRAFHEKERRPAGGYTKLQFFFLVFVASFAYYIIPGYFFQGLSAISIVCLIWKNSITAQQIGSGMYGLGIGSFSLDWNTVSGFLGSPLAVPGFAIINVLGGYVVFMYLVIPFFYWNNIYDAKKFPFVSSRTFDSTGVRYNVTRILNNKSFDIDMDSYNNYSKLHLSVIFALNYGLSFATLTATLSHVVLFHGKTIWSLWKKTASTTIKGDNEGDVHTRIMKKNYEQVPEWWFVSILALMIVMSLVACEGFGKQLQLPWWGFLLSLAIALVFTLPIGVIQATTNMYCVIVFLSFSTYSNLFVQQTGLNVITELIIGFMYPGKPLANVAFKTYGYISMVQALGFLGDFKLGHYMKIPPKSMFMAQLVGTVVASTVHFGTAWWLLTSIKNICDETLLSEGSPWTCPSDTVFYNASIIWGVVGPQRMFTKDGVYPEMNWFFLIGALAPVPVWLLARKFPNHKWIELINMPIIFGGSGNIPPVRSVNYTMWGIVGIYFNFYVYRKFKAWWARHTYVLAAALDAGIAFTGVLLYFALQNYDVYGPSWWGLEGDDHCPLARCPTAPGVVAVGCPIL
ncbi:hypothetical protein Lal_00038149 [Lupinus albus]|nr:hypothetical protein Lal_00038149 [Lupinus albus]